MKFGALCLVWAVLITTHVWGVALLLIDLLFRAEIAVCRHCLEKSEDDEERAMWREYLSVRRAEHNRALTQLAKRYGLKRLVRSKP